MKLIMNIFLFIAILALGGCADDPMPQFPYPEKEPDLVENLKEVPATRIERLKRGINVAHWFAQPLTEDGVTETTIKERFNDADWAFLKESGFTHVRLSVNEEVVYNDEKPEEINTAFLPLLDEAIQRFIDMGLAVSFDFHPNDSFKEEAYTIEGSKKAILFWESMAKYLSKFDDEYLYIEVMNEPSTVNATEWYALQKNWVAAIRKGAPTHTIIATGNLRATENDWNEVAALTSMYPVMDKNVVYNFHCYSPMVFTHQGSSWSWGPLVNISNLMYPANQSNVDVVKSTTGDAAANGALDLFMSEGWSKEKIKSHLAPLEAWMTKNKVPVICNEFGVYHTAPDASELLYLRDLREELEAINVGWAIWEYDQGYKIVEKIDGVVQFRNGIAQSLGLSDEPAGPDQTVLPDPQETGIYMITNYDAEESAYDAIYADPNDATNNWWKYSGGAIFEELLTVDPEPVTKSKYAKYYYSNSSGTEAWASSMWGTPTFSLPNDCQDVALRFDIKTEGNALWEMQLVYGKDGEDVNIFTYSPIYNYPQWTAVSIPLSKFGIESSFDLSLLNTFKINYTIATNNNDCWVALDNVRFEYVEGSGIGEGEESGDGEIKEEIVIDPDPDTDLDPDIKPGDKDLQQKIIDFDTEETVMDALYGGDWWTAGAGWGFTSMITDQTSDPVSEISGAYGVMSYDSSKEAEGWGSWMVGLGDEATFALPGDPSNLVLKMDIKTIGGPSYNILLNTLGDGRYSYAPTQTYDNWTTIEIPFTEFGIGWDTTPSNGEGMDATTINGLTFNWQAQEGTVKIDNVYIIYTKPKSE